MSDTTYQGYKNYETFGVCLHIDNNENLLEGWKARAVELRQEAEAGTGCDDLQRRTEEFGTVEAIRQTLADEIKAEYATTSDAIEVPAPFAAFISASLARVDWLEVADEYLPEVEA